MTRGVIVWILCSVAVAFGALAPAPDESRHAVYAAAQRGAAVKPLLRSSGPNPTSSRSASPAARGVRGPKNTVAPISKKISGPKTTPAHGKTPAPKTPSTPTASLPTNPSPKNVVVRIAIFRTGVEKSRFNDPFDKLKQQLQQLGPFQPFIVDDDCKSKACPGLSTAQIYIYAEKGQPADSAPHGSLSYTSYFLSGSTLQRIASVPVQLDTNGVATPLSESEAKSLIGSLTFDQNFNVSINLPDSEETLQLVPAPVDAADRDFEPILEHILETHGIASTRSRFTANALRGPSDALTCPGTQRYFVYRVRLAPYTYKLQGRVSIHAFAEGFILDCSAPAFVPAATGSYKANVYRTSDLLTDFSALLVALKPKIQTAAMTGGIASFSKLVDGDPSSKKNEESAAAPALELMVDRMCIRLLEFVPPSPSPSPFGSPLPSASGPPSRSSAPTPSPKPTRGPRPPLQCAAPLPSRRQATVQKGKLTPFPVPKTFNEYFYDRNPSPTPSPNP